MRFRAVLLSMLLAVLTSGCSMIMPILEVATRPLDKADTFAETQQAYTSDIRFGLYDDALVWVEPELQARFRAELPRFKDLRFSDAYTESIEMDAMKTEATAIVVYRGYSLASPYEREFRITQRWRRDAPRQDWFVTPDFDGLLSPVDVSTTPPASPAPIP